MSPPTTFDIPYLPEGDRDQQLDFYLPAARAFPTIVFVHGGQPYRGLARWWKRLSLCEHGQSLPGCWCRGRGHKSPTPSCQRLAFSAARYGSGAHLVATVGDDPKIPARVIAGGKTFQRENAQKFGKLSSKDLRFEISDPCCSEEGCHAFRRGIPVSFMVPKNSGKYNELELHRRIPHR